MLYYRFSRLESIYYFCEIDYIFKTEQWLPVVGYEGYFVSDLGRVKGIERIVYNGVNAFKKVKEKILKQAVASHGYLIVSCSGQKHKSKTRTVHKIVSESFLNHVPCNHKLVINHINHNRLDNRKTNLEITTQRKNADKIHLRSSSKYVGVHLRKDSGKWRSVIVIKKERHNLGTFENEIDAHNAYQDKLKSIINN